MIQKVLKVGSSIAVTIPKYVAEQLGFKAGDDIQITSDIDRRSMTIEPVIRQAHDGEVIAWSKGFIEKYKEALIALKDK